MKKFLITLFILLSINSFAETTKSSYQSPLSINRPNYFLCGVESLNKDDNSQVKFQLSIKYNLFYPTDIFYAGYTQQSWWRIFDKSSPFKENNYNPEFFLLFDHQNEKTFLSLHKNIDYIKIAPYEHKSNGETGLNNRSQDKYYIEGQFSYGDYINTGMRLKLFGYYHVAKENKDLDNYQGYYECELFVQLKDEKVTYFDKEKIYARFGCGADPTKGYIEYGFRIRLLTDNVQPYFFMQGFEGYNESMIRYNKYEHAIRMGLEFE